VKDINTRTQDAFYYLSPNAYLTDVNGTVFFRAFDPVHGEALWKTDGTEAGTSLVKEFIPNSIDAFPNNLTNVNGTLYFVGLDQTNGIALWKSDGTEAGTAPFLVTQPTMPGFPGHFVSFKGKLYFFSLTQTLHYGLWESDGTAAGTVLVKDLGRGNFQTDLGAEPVIVNGTLFFATNTLGFWKSDGTEAGTVLLPQISYIPPPFAPPQLKAVNGVLYIGLRSPPNPFTTQFELWRTDGTTAGTLRLGTFRVDSFPLANLTQVGGQLFFTVAGQIWKTNGTVAGTVLVKDHIIASNLSELHGALFFTAFNPAGTGDALWTSDGTSAGTVLVKTINPTGSAFVSGMTHVNGLLFFSASDGVNGQELWASDGTAGGTQLYQDINPGPADSSPQDLTRVGGQLFFTADDKAHGRELWVLQTPPVVDTVVINDGSAQRSMVTQVTVTFSDVLTLDTSGIELVSQDGQDVPFDVATSVVDGRLVAVLTFSGPDVIGGSLPDGTYTLIVHAGAAVDRIGQQLDGDQVTTFFRLFGDADGDGHVDFADLYRFRSAYGTSAGNPGYLSYFDYNQDGRIDQLDYTEFRRRLEAGV
jgi:ELWxxDGT repeat protein